MWIFNIVVLIILGVLGIASLLRTRRPDLDGPIKKLDAVEGSVGIVGLIWGVLSLLQWLSVARAVTIAPLTMVLSLTSTLAVLALSLIFAAGLLSSLAGNNSFSGNLARLSARLAPFKMILGCVCLAFAAYGLVRLII